MAEAPHEKLRRRAQEARLRGLAVAAQGTRERAELKAKVANAEVAFLDMIEGNAGHEVERVFKSGRLDPMLRAIPHIGPVAVDEICNELGIDKEVHVAKLSHATRLQISQLVEAVLDGRGLM
jgi:hypothetical protein